MSVNENTTRKILKILGILSLTAILFYLVILFSDVIIMLVISMMLALIFNPFVAFLEKQGVNRLISILFVFLISGGLMVFGFSVLIPKIIYQINTLTNNVNQENVNFLLKQIEGYYK